MSVYNFLVSSGGLIGTTHCLPLKTMFFINRNSYNGNRIYIFVLPKKYFITHTKKRNWRKGWQKVLTYLLTPWSRVLLEKLTVNFAASQEIPRISWNSKIPHRTHKCPPLTTSTKYIILKAGYYKTCALCFLCTPFYWRSPIDTCIINHIFRDGP
jgi:hypothetical protein